MELTYLQGYDDETLEGVRRLVARGGLGPYLATKYPGFHPHTTNTLLRGYVEELRRRHLKTAPAVSRVDYDDQLVAGEAALGLHTFESRGHGGRLRASSGIRIAGVFRRAPPEFLRMIVVHELAHLREREHTKAFWRLCVAMESDYHQLEFDVRLWLTARALGEAQT